MSNKINFIKVFWSVLIVLNTILLMNSLIIENYPNAFLNFIVGVYCWHRYYKILELEEK